MRLGSCERFNARTCPANLMSHLFAYVAVHDQACHTTYAQSIVNQSLSNINYLDEALCTRLGGIRVSVLRLG